MFNTIKNWWITNVWQPSQTKLVAWVYGIPAAIVSVFEAVSKFAGDNTITTYLAQLNVPNWIPVMMTVIALVHYVAHGRSDD